MAATFTRGETIRFETTITGRDGALATPDTSVTISIEDSDGTVQVSAASCTASSTGRYYYLYDSSASAATGTWYYEFKATDGGHVSIEGGSFTMAASTTEA